MHPDPYQKRSLNEAEPIPASVVGRLADSVIDHYEQLTRYGRPAGEALWPPVEDPKAVERAADRAVTEFEQAAGQRDWTAARERVRQLAADAIGLYVEGYAYNHDRDRAHAAAVLECLEGEAARAEVYQPPPEIEAPAPTARGERPREGGER